MALPAENVTAVVASAAARSEGLSEAAGADDPFDVWTHTLDGSGDRLRENPRDTDRALAQGLAGDWGGQSIDGVFEARDATRAQLIDEFEVLTGLKEGPDPAPPSSPLAKVGATFGVLTTLEQVISTAFSAIPFPAFPALRVTDMDVGLPHAHSHPPNLVPPAPPVPFPSTGPIIPIPFLSGATRTLINGMPAARCGDMGLGIWCGGYFPMYEVFLGSSSVWVEGARAGRLLVDVTHHCIFSAPKPSDPPLGPPVGMTVTASPNVLIGGVPLPSLLNLAMGAAMKGLFSAFGKVIKKVKASRLAKASRASGGSQKAFSRATHGSGFKSIWDFHPKVIHRVFVTEFRDLLRKFQPPVKPRGFKSPEAFAEAFQRADELMKRGAVAIDDLGDAAFRSAVIEDLRLAVSSKAGRQVFDDILENHAKHGTQVTIKKKQPGMVNHAAFNSSAVVDAKTGTLGTPSHTDIYYDPTNKAGLSPGTTSDCTLLHEAVHASRAGRGTSYSNVPLASPVDQARWTDVEEMETIAIENMHREERGLPLRDGHDDMP